MNKSIVKFPHDTFTQLKQMLLSDHNEKHAFLLCNMAKSVHDDLGTVYLVDTIIGFEHNEISVSSTHVEIENDLVNGIFKKFINSKNLALISCHSHPFEKGDVSFSSIDDRNDHKLFEYFYSEMVNHKSDARMLTMVFGQETIATRGYECNSKSFVPVDKIVVMDFPLQYIVPTNSIQTKKEFNHSVYDRQILAFGELGQEKLSQLKVTLVGAGGTGSILAESLVRLGVKHLVLVDDDRLEESNLNRWQSGKMNQVGQYKVDILKNNLSLMAKEVKIQSFTSTIFDKKVIDHVKDSDVIIGAVDSNKARYLLNRISLSYLIPYLDCSSGIIVKKNKIEELSTRNVIVVPSVTHCFNCEEVYYKKSEFTYDFVSEGMREEAKRRKYIQAEVDITSPSVYALNMLSVSTLMLEFMNLFLGYKEVLVENTYINYIHIDKEDQKRAWTHEAPSLQCIDCQDRVAKGDRTKVWELFFKESAKMDQTNEKKRLFVGTYGKVFHNVKNRGLLIMKGLFGNLRNIFS